MSITQFTIEEVRCFNERQTLEIRPLTFWLGKTVPVKLQHWHVFKC